MRRPFFSLIGALLLGACARRPSAPAAAGALPIPTEAALARNAALTSGWWEDQLRSRDPRAAVAAEQALVDGGGRSLPLLGCLLRSRDAAVYAHAVGIVHRIGPDAIPLLTAMLEDHQLALRRSAADILVDLAPDTESIQPALQTALKDEDAEVACDAARALGALGERAAASTPALVEALAHRDPHVRLYAAEALASIGPRAAAVATAELVKALHDPDAGVRWGACEALAGFGPAAAAAVPALMGALKDEFLYVRLCAAGALGSIGSDASTAVEALAEASKDPTLQAEARWALDRITGTAAATSDAVVELTAPTPFASPSTRPSLASGDPPTDWDVQTGRNIAWSVPLGGESFGRPVVADGVVYVGTDNALKRNPAFADDCGVLAAFRESDGTFLGQDLAPRVKRGLGEFLLPSTTSAPSVEGDHVYYVTAECQLRCLDKRGFRDGRNSGAYQSERFQDEKPAGVIWELDLCAALGVFPHESSNSDVLPVGDLLVICTSNGQNQGHTRVPSPRAPGLIAVDKLSGKVVWRAIGAGERVLHGQWSSPIAADIGGRTQALFGGGDGWLRAYDAQSGREVWRFDGNPKDARYLPRPGVLSRSPIVAPPVYADGRVFLAMGDDPSHGDGPSLLHAISPGGQGDVTESRRLWTSGEVGRVVGAPVVDDGLLYAGDLGGRVTCLDAATGKLIWKHDTDAPIWGCLLLAGGRLYVGNVDGTMTVLRSGRRREVLAQIEMDSALYSRPALVRDALYLATARRLYRIASPPKDLPNQ